MFFSVEFGIGKEVEPRFYNTECATATLLRAIRDDAVAVIASQIDVKVAEYKREIPRLEQEIADTQSVPKGAKPGKAEEWKQELQRIKTNLPKLEELLPLLVKVVKVDLSFTEATTGRLNLDFEAYAYANTFFQAKCRTWLVGITADSNDGFMLKWDL
jgi:hypothetical protein